MDELAELLKIDPIELRLRNYADTQPDTGAPWPSKNLKECYARGAERFGWSRRPSTPGTAREGNLLIGYGMASAGYPVYQPVQTQRARAIARPDGTFTFEAGIQDFGTGAGTAMSQVGADALGVAASAICFEYGDTAFPETTAAVGSTGAAMIGSVVNAAGDALRSSLIRLAVADKLSPLHGVDADTVTVRNGVLSSPTGASDTYADVVKRSGRETVEELGTWAPPMQKTGSAPYGMSFGAQFAEVSVDKDLGLVRVRRMVGAFAIGRVLNAKTAHSQLMGGMLWGLGQALLEATHMDPRVGRWANSSLGDYLVSVNADAPEIEIEFVEGTDTVINPMGVKGCGEIGMVGAAAAIANAVFNATGKRVRELPITIEHMM